MSARSLDQLPVRATHASDEEYVSFLRGRPSLHSSGTNQMKRYRSFRRRYPDLDAWLDAPLPDASASPATGRSPTARPSPGPICTIWPTAASSASTGIGSSASASTGCLPRSSRPPSMN